MTNKPLNCIFLIFLGLSIVLNSCTSRSNGEESNLGIIQNADSDTIHIIDGVFDIPELTIIPSPDSKSSFTFPTSEKVVDYDVSPAGITVAALVESGRKCFIKFWQIGKNNIGDSCLLPEGLNAKSIAWHPMANALFVMGKTNTDYQIFRVEKTKKNWLTKNIYTSGKPLRRLVVCPRPFITNYDYKSSNTYYSYRIFFGMDNGDKSYRIVSITETGNRFYQVIGPKETFSSGIEMGADDDPSNMVADFALPLAFHPGGHEMIWENRTKNFFVARYNSRIWGDYKALKIGLSPGSITPTPNGLGILHWQNNKNGIGVYLLSTKKEEIQLSDYAFTSTPSSVPDGKGIVGLTNTNGKITLNYLPINVPLADVLNAWMFADNPEEVSLFQKNFGLFRPNNGDQLYQLYETENYYCNNYHRNVPTRPYLVTTDIFWELFGAAYQGLFIVKERDEAIPNFWKFINEADKHFKASSKSSSWTPVFKALKEFNDGKTNNPEVIKIQKEQDTVSDITKKQYAYSDLKPRGHYTSNAEMKKYFKAFRYFTTISKTNQAALAELNSLPKEVIVHAKKWIESYTGFISPSRSPMVWPDLQKSLPAYCQHPKKDLTIFPLSWGFDNEVLYSTVYHLNLPTELQVTGSNGHRILPSGLDLAAVLGSGLAESLLESDYQDYPPLRKVISNLKDNFAENGSKPESKNNLYNQWINALAVQWADTLHSTNGDQDKEIWQTKRLQTGLATWATLRHATILVNERTVAECGEGGFEEILMRAPRGYVEPDPYTFASIADMFETAIGYVAKSTTEIPDKMDYFDQEKRSLYDGIIKRLKEAAAEARTFQKMAEKERKGVYLSNKENEKILFVARTAEHLFLIFNSLSDKDYALSNPDPMAKIADVAGGGSFPYLMSAVGNTMEWNYIVPFYGRHQIVKGSIYSYYEFSSGQLLNDEEWRKQVKKQELLPWIKPYISYQNASGQAKTGY